MKSSYYCMTFWQNYLLTPTSLYQNNRKASVQQCMHFQSEAYPPLPSSSLSARFIGSCKEFPSLAHFI